MPFFTAGKAAARGKVDHSTSSNDEFKNECSYISNPTARKENTRETLGEVNK